MDLCICVSTELIRGKVIKLGEKNQNIFVYRIQSFQPNLMLLLKNYNEQKMHYTETCMYRISGEIKRISLNNIKVRMRQVFYLSNIFVYKPSI